MDWGRMKELYRTLASLPILKREGVPSGGEPGIPLLYLYPLPWTRSEWLERVSLVVAAVKEYCPEWREEAERVKLHIERSRLSWEEFLPALLRQEEKAYLRFLNFLGRHRLDKEVAGFIFHHALKLCLRGCASSFRPQDFEYWQHGSCPVCGRYPHLARLKKGRLLYCSLCEAAWPYPRLGCPFCGHSSPEGEELLAWEGTPYRVYLYSCCGSYLKAVVETGAVDHPFDPVKVEGETLPLDLTAWREGFSPAALSLFPAFTFERGLRERR
ncbi:formate dehydrogenase accessory protein FdhE [Ammonifex thiophilus]|uniref:Formate dehydrogenase accessory protein FdhE n=1 Tax=Ammonifex thiophilus TaxID=444093 RepID=A0A3D8P653_9THEO|nr:formate dehydrogenase accessory protein FdhE [Ammonifex thiophilus]RDV84806.1 formate dehydrogenase accessory protein FdhE [Ammonifex thiophilus]